MTTPIPRPIESAPTVAPHTPTILWTRPELCCEWCGAEWLEICRLRAECEGGR